MTVIGITGPSGAGKGEASRIISQKYGFPVVDADKVYHALISSPSACLDEIKANFGDKVIDKKGALDRRALAEEVFGEENRERLDLLNKITHKYVVREIKKTVDQLRKAHTACVIDAPLLIEAELCSECNFTMSVLADKTVRAKRIAARDNISFPDAMKRINSQKSDEFYIENTDYTVRNDSDLDSLASSVRKILSERRVI